MEDEDKDNFYSASIHLVDRAYGGPEEGGWYFDYGEPDDGQWIYTRLFETAKEAREYADNLEWVVAAMNEDRYEIGSVLSSGRFAWIIQGGYPHAWPKERPHYE